MAQTPAQTEYQRNYYRLNREKRLEQARERFKRSEVKERRKAYLATRRDKEKAYNWEYKLKLYYGMTPRDWNHMLTMQSNRCAICGTDNPGRRGWSMDHCHKTKTNRAILCQHCNFLLGHAKDNPEILRTAANYLEVLDDYGTSHFCD